MAHLDFYEPILPTELEAFLPLSRKGPPAVTHRARGQTIATPAEEFTTISRVTKVLELGGPGKLAKSRNQLIKKITINLLNGQL